MEKSMKKVIALVLAVILTFSVVTIIKNDGLTASAASTSSVSIKKSPTLKAGTVKATSVKLSWTTTKNADSYKLYKSTNNKNWQGVVTTKATSYTVSKLTAGTKYYFKLVAVSGKTKSPYSNTVAVTPKPERVGSLKIKFSSNTQASVTWNKVSGAIGYELFLSTSSDFKNDLKKVTVKGGNKTSYTIKGMKNGKTYYVKVRAVTTAGKKTVVGTCSYPSQLITKTKTYYNYVNQTVYATANVNVRKGANTSYAKVGLLKKGSSITRTAIGNNGWSKVSYNGTTAYISSSYLTTKKPEVTTTHKQESTTKKQETTTKKQEDTTKKPTTTKPTNDGSIAKTSGGIKLYPITSSTAKAIANSSIISAINKGYEGRSADGKTIVVYGKISSGWIGQDSSEAFYNASGEKEHCEHCGKINGTGKNMCNGQCVMNFS